MAAARIQRTFSGIQPTGIPHLGNYLGALKNWVRLQDEAKASHGRVETFFSVVDLHAMSVPYDASALRHQTLSTAATLLACGVSESSSVLFRQSAVREHTELAWTLGCVTPLGWLQRMTQFKSKGKGDKAAAGLGLLAYPVLQAADILLYQATHVPVGEDQLQHLELARDIAVAFHSRFTQQQQAGQEGETPPSSEPAVFQLPAAVSLPSGAARIMSLSDGSRKMSKSDPSDWSRINLTDSAALIRDKIRRAKTDSVAGFTYDPVARPEKSNLLAIFAAVTERPVEEIAAEHVASSAAAFKDALSDAIAAVVVPIGERVAELAAAPGRVEAVLEEGANRARRVAQVTMGEVRRVTGVA